MVDGAKSSTCEITSGVPQGSVLGPILFLIYINDITINIHSEIRLFADDILLYRAIKLPNDHSMLQGDLNTLTKWADDWMMKFNISKCKIMQITTHNSKSPFIYKMCNMPLNIVTEHMNILASVFIISYPGVLILIVFEIRQIAYWVS